MFQHLLGVLLVIMVYFFTRRALGTLTAVIAASFLAIYPVLIYFEGQLLFESVLTFLCFAWIMLLYHTLKKPSMMLWFSSGLLLGVISITRPPFLLVGSVVLIYVLTTFPRESASPKTLYWFSLAVLAGIIFIVGPVTLRNYCVENDFVLIASQGGVNFFIGNNPDADGHSSSIPDALGPSWENRDLTHYVETQVGRAIKPSEESWFWYKRGFEFIVDSPLAFAKQIARKAYLFWNHYEIPNNHSYYYFEQNSSLLKNIPFGFGFLAPLGLTGFFLLWRIKEFTPVVLFVLTYFLVTIAFFVCDRFRVPIIPVLCVSGSYAMVSFWRTIFTRGYVKAGMMVTAFLILFAISNSDLIQISDNGFAREYLAMGIVELDRGKAGAAIENFRRADSLAHGLPNTKVNWGIAEWVEGNEDEAIKLFNEELSANPRSYGTLLNLALVHLSRGSLDSALLWASECTVVKPYASAGYTTLAEILLRAGELDRADSVLAVGASKTDQDYSFGEYLLAGIALKHGDASAAETVYRSLLDPPDNKRQPRYEPEFEFSNDRTIGPGSADLRGHVLYSLGHVYVAKGRIDSAATYFRLASHLLPANPNVWADLGVSLINLDDQQGAETALRAAIRLDPSRHLYWFNLGTTLAIQQKFMEADSAFSKCVLLAPEFNEAVEQLRRLRGLQEWKRDTK